jgi:putative aldouronate transport system permease protein
MTVNNPIAPARAHGRRRGWRDTRRGDLSYDIVASLILTTTVLAILYPLWFITIASVSDPADVSNGHVWLWPSGFTLDGYQRLLNDPTVWRGVWNSMVYTGGATLVSVTLILCAGYALSRKDLPGRNLVTGLFLLTFFFEAGIIPRYLVVQELGLLNTAWAVILPSAIAVWNLLIARTWFAHNIPIEVREAAQLDGAGELRTFLRIVLPLSKPLIGVMALIHLVWNWNSFFDALIYLTDEERFPLQLVLRNILVQSELSASGDLVGDLESFSEQQRVAGIIKYAMIVVSTIPLLLVSPIAQRYLARGGVSGAIKG